MRTSDQPSWLKAAFLFTCITIATFAKAQQFTLQGVAFRKNATQRLAKVLITDQRSNTVVTADDLGIFHVSCAMGDTLLFRLKDYTDQKLLVTNQNDLFVYMTPVISLKQVEITGQTKKQELNDVVNAYRSKGLYFDGRPPISTFSPFGGSPVTGFHELFGKDAENERHFIKFSKSELEQTEIDRRFTPLLVKQVTGIKDDDLKAFMAAYRPLYTDIKKWNDYDLMNYIKRSYKNFLTDVRTDKQFKALLDTMKRDNFPATMLQ